jgi:Uma2 family endonuclease
VAQTLTAIDLDDPDVGLLTPDAFFAAEWEADRRHEYLNGTVLPMSGASPTHYLIAANLMWLLGSALRRMDFAVAQSDCGVWTPELQSWTYPDVVCYPLPGHYVDDAPRKLLNPAVVFEILSPSTEQRDRTDKFDAYQTIETLTDYVLVHQDRVRIEHFRRQGPNEWLLTIHDGLDATLRLDSIGAEVPLREAYLKTSLLDA